MKVFSLKARLLSIKYAFRGIKTVILSQHNAWIHLVATLVVLIAGFYFGLNKFEWCWIIFAIAIVWITEAINTAIENLADAVSPDYHPLIEKAKDVAAGAVLISAITAVIIGALVFQPYLF